MARLKLNLYAIIDLSIFTGAKHPLAWILESPYSEPELSFAPNLPLMKQATHQARTSSEPLSEDQALAIMKDLLLKIAGVEPEKVVREANFIQDLEVDSLGMMEMLLDAEDQFGAEFDIAEAPDIKTVGDLLDLLKKHGGIA